MFFIVLDMLVPRYSNGQKKHVTSSVLRYEKRTEKCTFLILLLSVLDMLVPRYSNGQCCYELKKNASI
ncbi:hypothetical protein FLAV_02883 [Flavobacteriales bacterium]|nr:hypothetical protein FLAV_02883 [Flavobacteriales bacterium]